MPGPHPERRQLLKAGALLWTAPVIILAGAAPAFAVSGADMSTSTGTFVVRNSNFLDGSAVLRNSGSGGTSGLGILVTSTAGVSQNAGQHTPPTGWTTSVVSSTQVRFVAPPGAQMGAGTTLSVTFTVRRTNTVSGTISATIEVDDPGTNGAMTSSTY